MEPYIRTLHRRVVAAKSGQAGSLGAALTTLTAIGFRAIRQLNGLMRGQGNSIVRGCAGMAKRQDRHHHKGGTDAREGAHDAISD